MDYKKILSKSKKSLRKLSTDKNFLTLSYKLLHDALFLMLISFTLILIAEGLLPGIATAHISLTKIVVAIVLIISGIIFIGKKLDYVYPKTRLKDSKILPILITGSFLLIGNSLLRFALWQNIIITILTLFVFILFYHLLFSDTE